MVRRLQLPRALLALLVLHCTEQPEGDDAPEPPAPPPPVGVPTDAGPTYEQCLENTRELDIPERAECAQQVFACSSCGDFMFTVGHWLVEQCPDLSCGEFLAGVRGGCITTAHVLDDIRGAECIRERLLGTRWACGPETGLARVYLGSCTLR
jgi:hypothetical protein